MSSIPMTDEWYPQAGKISRTKEEAIEILHGYFQRIKAAEADDAGNPAPGERATDKVFKEIATQYSDCSSHKTNGDL